MIFWIRKDFRNKKKAYILKIGANPFGEVTSFLNAVLFLTKLTQIEPKKLSDKFGFIWLEKKSHLQVA